MITSDCHMHTSFSTDSSTAPEAMVEGALEKGLKARNWGRMLFCLMWMHIFKN